MNVFQDTPITDRETGHTFMHRSYCASPEEAAAYARLTFSQPGGVCRRGESLVRSARKPAGHFILGSLENPASNPAPGAVSGAPSHSGKTACADWLMGIHNLDAQPDGGRIQTELF